MKVIFALIALFGATAAVAEPEPLNKLAPYSGIYHPPGAAEYYRRNPHFTRIGNSYFTIPSPAAAAAPFYRRFNKRSADEEEEMVEEPREKRHVLEKLLGLGHHYYHHHHRYPYRYRPYYPSYGYRYPHRYHQHQHHHLHKRSSDEDEEIKLRDAPLIEGKPRQGRGLFFKKFYPRGYLGARRYYVTPARAYYGSYYTTPYHYRTLYKRSADDEDEDEEPQAEEKEMAEVEDEDSREKRGLFYFKQFYPSTYFRNTYFPYRNNYYYHNRRPYDGVYF